MMSVMDWIGLVLAGAILIYLIIAMFFPEKF
ncbi:MAG: potassium-transporting ATPase subunit F [Phycisphaerae bacterium]